MRSLFTVAISVVTLSVASSAFAQDPVVKPAAVVKPAPGQAAAAAPSPAAVPITATCSLGDHPGIEDGEAHTAADVICHELAKRGATNTDHEVRMGKLGGRTLITLASRDGNGYDEVRTFVNGLDELDIAAPRMATSLIENKPMEQTRTVDTVMTNETQAPKIQQGAVGAEMGMFGMSSIGQASAPSAGFEIGIGYRAKSFGIIAAGRLGGIGSDNDKLATASIDIGGRYYLGDGDIAPFVGAGLGVSYFNHGGGGASGVGGYTAVGVEMLRSHHMGMVMAARVDLPFYSIEGWGVSGYTAPVSLTMAIAFH